MQVRIQPLPDEMLLKLFNILGASDWTNFKLVSKAWRELILELCFSKRRLTQTKACERLTKFWGNYFPRYVSFQKDALWLRHALHSAQEENLFETLSFMFNLKEKTFSFTDDTLREMIKTPINSKMIPSLLPFLSNTGVEIIYQEVVAKETNVDEKFAYMKNIAHRLTDSRADLLNWIEPYLVVWQYADQLCPVLEKMAVFFSDTEIQKYASALRRIIRETISKKDAEVPSSCFDTLLVFTKQMTPLDCFYMFEWALCLICSPKMLECCDSFSLFIKGLWPLILKPDQRKLFDKIKEEIRPTLVPVSELGCVVILKAIVSFLDSDQKKWAFDFAHGVLKKESITKARPLIGGLFTPDIFNADSLFPLLAESLQDDAEPKQIKEIYEIFNKKFYYLDRKCASKSILDCFDKQVDNTFLTCLSSSMNVVFVPVPFVQTLGFCDASLNKIDFYKGFFEDSHQKTLVSDFLKVTEKKCGVPIPIKLMNVLMACLENADSNTIDNVLKRLFSIMKRSLDVFQCCKSLFSTMARLELLIPYFFKNNTEEDALHLFGEVFEHLHDHFDESFIHSFFSKIISHVKTETSCSSAGVKIFFTVASPNERQAFLEREDMVFSKNGFHVAAWLAANQYVLQEELPRLENKLSITMEWQKKILHRLADAMQELYPVQNNQKAVAYKKL